MSKSANNIVTVEIDKANGNGKSFAVKKDLWVTNFTELIASIKSELGHNVGIYGTMATDGEHYKICINSNRAKDLNEFNKIVLKYAKFGEKPAKVAKVKKDKASTQSKEVDTLKELIAKQAEMMAQMMAQMSK